MSNDPVDVVLARLTKVKQTKSGWVALCPGHDDSKQSLSISRGSDGRVLLRCFAGCSVEKIAEGLKLEMKDLFPPRDASDPLTVADLAADKHLPLSFLKGLGIRDIARGVEIVYRLADGAVAPRRRIRTARRAKDGSLWTAGKGGIVSYGLDRLGDARTKGYVILVEGESDCWTLWHHGIPALGVPGAQMIRVLEAEQFNGISKVFIQHEPDQGGETFVGKASDRIRSFGTGAEILEFSVAPHKDVNDLHRYDEAGFRVAFDRAIAAAIPAGSTAAGAVPWAPPARFYRVTVPDFPVDRLPAKLRAFVEEQSVALQVPRALIGCLVLVVVTITVAGKVRIEVRDSWSEPLTLFCGIAMAPGNRKSAAFRAVTTPLIVFEEHEALRLAPELRRQYARRRVLLQALRKAEQEAAKTESEGLRANLDKVNRIHEELAGTEDLEAPRLFGDDATPEALSRLMARHGGRFAVLSAEGGVFELMAGRYSNSGAANFDIYLKGHAGDTVRVDRVQREGERINAAILSVGLTFQPDVLRSLASKPGFSGRGLLARFLFVLPESPLGRRVIGAPPVSDRTANEYESLVLLLLRDTPVPKDPKRPPTIRLSIEALDAIEQFEGSIEPRLGRDGDLGIVAEWGSKLAGAIARLAAILHVARLESAAKAVCTPVALSTMTDAIALGEFFLAHARAAFAEMGADPDVERARTVLRWLKRNPTLTSFTRRDVHQALKSRFPKVDELGPAIRLLLEHEYIRIIDTNEPVRPGRPKSPSYDVNPLWDRDSEDCEDIEEASVALGLGSGTSQDSSKAGSPPPDVKSNLSSQNPHNPQNPSSVTCDCGGTETWTSKLGAYFCMTCGQPIVRKGA